VGDRGRVVGQLGRGDEMGRRGKGASRAGNGGGVVGTVGPVPASDCRGTRGGTVRLT